MSFDLISDLFGVVVTFVWVITNGYHNQTIIYEQMIGSVYY